MKIKMISKYIIAILILFFAGTSYASDACQPVEREMTYGRVDVEDAKDKSGYLKAAKKFQAAADKAPNCAQAYFNLGLVYEKAGEYAKAINPLQTYLILSPNAADAPQVRSIIIASEYRAEKIAKAQEIEAAEVLEAKGKAQRLVGIWSNKDNNTRFRIRTKGDNNNEFEIHQVEWCPMGDCSRGWQSGNRMHGYIRAENGSFILSVLYEHEMAGGMDCKYGPGYAIGTVTLEENGDVLKSRSRLPSTSGNPACGSLDGSSLWKRYR